MSAQAGLFDSAIGARRRTSRALVPLNRDRCPNCGHVLDIETTVQAPLLRHGGYGAATAATRVHCPCGWTLLRETQEVRP